MCKIKCCKQLHLSSFGEDRQYVSQALLQNTFVCILLVYNQAFLKSLLSDVSSQVYKCPVRINWMKIQFGSFCKCQNSLLKTVKNIIAGHKSSQEKLRCCDKAKIFEKPPNYK